MKIDRTEFEAGISLVDLFVRTGLCKSKSEARRLIEQGGATVNDEKMSDVDATLGTEAISGDAVMLRAGKKRYFQVIVGSAPR